MKFMLYDQNQPLLIPLSTTDCLKEDHFCFIVSDIVDNLDLSDIEAEYKEEGAPAYHPKMMIKTLFYGYSQGVRSSRKIEAKTDEDIAFRYLAANHHLSHSTVSLFRKDHLDKLPIVFTQIITAASALGLADFSDISIDGTKIKASASKDNLFTKEEIAKVKTKMATILAEAEKIDREEDKKFGNKRGYNQIPKRLADPKTRQEEIRKIQKKLSDLAKADKAIDQKQQEAKKTDEDNRKNGKPVKKGKGEQDKTNTQTTNTTDPEASLMKMKDGSFKMAYNAEITASKQFIAAYGITDDPSDTDSLPEMIKKTEENTGQKVETAKADSTYFTKDNIRFLKDNQTEAFIPDTLMEAEKRKEEKENRENTSNKYDRKNFTYDEKNDEFICPEGKRLRLKKINKTKNTGTDDTDGTNGSRQYRGCQCQHCPMKLLCTKGKARYLRVDFELERIRKEMREKLNTDEGKLIYGERLYEIEPVMGNLKHNMGFAEFLCKGKEMALTELGLASSAHNLKKIFYGLKRLKRKRTEIKWNSLMRPQVRIQTA